METLQLGNLKTGREGGTMRGLGTDLRDHVRPKKTASNDANKQTNKLTDRQTDRHCDSMTKSAQWGRFGENCIVFTAHADRFSVFRMQDFFIYCALYRDEAYTSLV